MGTANKLEQVTKTQGEQESTLQQYKLLRLPQPTPRNRRSDSPVEIEDSTGDMTAPSGPPLNRNEIRAWEKTNAALYSVLFLTTSGAARCLLRKYETKKGQKADGREA